MIVKINTVPAPNGRWNWLLTVNHDGIEYPLLTTPKSRVSSQFSWDAEKFTERLKSAISDRIQYEKEKVDFIAYDDAIKDYIRFMEMSAKVLVNIDQIIDYVYTDIDNGVYPEYSPRIID